MGKRGKEEAGKSQDAEEVDKSHQEEALPVSKSSLTAAGEVGMSARHPVG